MPRRSLLTPAERTSLLAFPTTDDEFIRQRRGNRNRLGFAVQLYYLRYPGFVLLIDAEPSTPLRAPDGIAGTAEPFAVHFCRLPAFRPPTTWSTHED